MTRSPQTPVHLDRRAFLSGVAGGLGRIALASLAPGLSGCLSSPRAGPSADERARRGPRFAPRARRVVCLFQSGGLSHVDLFSDKAALRDRAGEELPASVRGTQRVTGMTSGQASFPVVPPLAPGRRCGDSGLFISDLLPHLQTVADELCLLQSLHTEAINHDPAITLFNTGNQLPGYASIGSWVGYGLGSENHDLPAFLALVSQGSGKNPGQPIFSRLWGNGFLPASHQGVGLRAGGNPVLFLDDPEGLSRAQRRAQLDDLAALESSRGAVTGDADGTAARIAAFELAFRMQTAVPELVDTRGESAATLRDYGPDVRRPGSYAAHCLLARRLLERGVRFVQLFHRGWDQHVALSRQLPNQCRDVDQPSAALLRDLKQRGLLDDTLVVFATEFGRTAFSQGRLGDPSSGRDHHGRCFSIWLAGGGVRGGVEYGATDDFAYNIARDPVHVRDLHATLLHLLGLDHERLVFPFRGLDARLTGVEPARVVHEILV